MGTHFPCLRYLDLSCSESLMRTPDFREMPNLEYLNLARCTSLEEVDDSLGYCGKLIQCNLSGCSSLKRFPCVNVESLEILNLSGNNFEHLPRSIAQLAAIRSLHLSDCKRLKELPGFMGMPNLESLNLGNCDDLEEVDDSLGYCGKLIRLDLGSCKSLKRFPYVNVESLEFFNLRDCSSLEKFPEIGGRMKPELKIEMKDSGIRELPSSFFKTGTHLTKLDLSFMKHLVSLPSSIGMLKSLVKLNVSDCSKLESLPEEMGDLESLVELNVSDCSKLESLPEEMGDLENLEKLNASYTVISRPPSSIARLNKLKFLSFTKHISQVGFQDGMCFVFPPVNDGLRSLERLCLCYCNLEDEGLPEDIGSLSSLKELSLVGNNFEHLPRSIVQLGALKFLGLSDCERLKELPGFMGMPNLESLNLGNCDDLEEVDDSLGYCGKLIQLDLGSCKSLKRFPCVNVESLEFLNLRDCSSLEKFPEFRGRMKPELMIKMNGSGIRELPSSFFQSGTHLTKLDLSFMKHLVSLPSSIGMLKSLVKLNVSFFSKLESLPEEIGDLENLEKLDASYTLISRPPSSIARLNKLKFLSFTKHISQVGFQDGMCFVFPPVNDGLRSLERLCLSYCNLEDEGLPEDIGSLSSLKELRLRGNNFEHLPRSIAQLGALEYLYLTDCEKLKELPGFMGMPNLEYLNLGNYDDLKEVDDSLGYCGKLIRLYLGSCKSLKMFPCVNVESLEFLNLRDCSSLEKFPEIRGRMKPELKIKMNGSGIRELPSSYFQSGTHLTKLDLSFMKHLVALPSRIGMLKSLVELDVSDCSSLEILPEEIGHLENLERLDAHSTLISRPPSSIVRLNKLKLLNFEKQKSQVGLVDRVNLVFPQVNEGLHSLERLYLSYCNLKDGGLPEDIGSLSSLKELYLNGNNFENLPRSIAQLGALRILDVSDCMKLTQLPEFPQQLDTIDADWSNDWICNSLFQNISSLQHGISASDSLRVFTSRMNIPSWFQHWGIDRSVSVKLPENWYVSDNFLGFVVCYSGSLIETTAQLIPLCDDGMSWMTQKLALSNHSKYDIQIQFFVPNIQFFLVPLAGLWDTSKTNGKTPNDYGLIRLSFSGELKKFGLRLLYKDEPKLGKRQSRYDDSEASSSSCKKQRPHYNINRSFAFENLQQQVEAPVSSETLQLFPTSSGV